MHIKIKGFLIRQVFFTMVFSVKLKYDERHIIVDRVQGEWGGCLHKIDTHTWAHAHLLLQYLLGHLGPLGTIKGMQAYTSAYDLFDLQCCFHHLVSIHTASQKLQIIYGPDPESW